MAPVKSAVGPVITPATDLTTNIGIHSRKSVVAAHARSEHACQEFERRAQLLRECLCSEDFLANKGIGNEIGFHTFAMTPRWSLRRVHYLTPFHAMPRPTSFRARSRS